MLLMDSLPTHMSLPISLPAESFLYSLPSEHHASLAKYWQVPDYSAEFDGPVWNGSKKALGERKSNGDQALQ